MRRRDFIGGLAGISAAWPLAAHAQRPGLPVIGFVNSASPGGYPPVSAFLKGLDEAGFVDGRDVTIEYHWAEGHYEKLPVRLATSAVGANAKCRDARCTSALWG
jgi:putative ABC transport system substrate-binding protein